MNTQENKIALVTGGSRGLGRDMAINLAKKGINVVLTYKSNEQATNEVVAEIENSGQKALALQLDVSDHNKYADFFSNVLSPRLQEKFHASKFDDMFKANRKSNMHADLRNIWVAFFDYELRGLQKIAS